jgi:hypothetical protein
MHDAGGPGYFSGHSAGHSSTLTGHHHAGHSAQQQPAVPYFAPRGWLRGVGRRATRILLTLIFVAAAVAAVMAALNLHF